MTDPASGGEPWWAAADTTDQDPVLLCVICGAPVGIDPADDRHPLATRMCGDCTRAREFDQTLWELDLAEPDAGLW